jgi:hypothetical protein
MMGGLSRNQHITRSICAATVLEEPARLAGRFPLKTMMTGGITMRKQLAILASSALLISVGTASAQKQTPQQYDKSGAPSGLQSTTSDKPSAVTLPEAKSPAPDATGAPVSETTGQAPKFEDRWSAQRDTPDRPPAATTSSETTGQTPSMSKKMGPEMEGAGDLRAAPDDE